MSDPTEALEAVSLMRSDERLAELVRWTTTADGLTALVEHARAVVLPPEQDEQRQRVVSSWAALSTDVPGIPPADQAQAVALAAKAWDFRLGKERDFIPTSAELLPPEAAALVYGLAAEWGMNTPVTPNGHYDVVMPIGGLVRANLARPTAAAAWLKSGLVTTDLVVGLAADRAFLDKEEALAKQLGVPYKNEPDSLRYGLEKAFDLDPSAWADDQPGVAVNSTGPVLTRFATAPLIGDRRANTAEAAEWYRGHGLLPATGSLLVVATPIYWIASHIAFRTTVDPALRVTTTGSGEEHAPSPRQIFRSQHYLQEIKASMDMLPRIEKWARDNQ
jgi:hypothetical protein